MTGDERRDAAKVPAATLGFWGLKILATTLGETGGDTLSMTFGLGYLVSSAVFLGALAILLVAQVSARRFRPLLYWVTIVASTTAGTTLADFATRSLGIGYPGGALLLAACVAGSLLLWRMAAGKIASDSISGPVPEAFYWLTITASQTLGTALGDWAADTGGLGYSGGAILFGSLLAVVALLAWRTRISRVALFWAAFILTRPLGATLGDLLDKPLDQGGFALNRPIASAVLAAAVLILVIVLPQRPGRHAGTQAGLR